MNSQTFVHHKWVLMSIESLETGIKKEIGEYAFAHIEFNTDTTYKGFFCNAFNGKMHMGKNQTLKINHPSSTKKMCMGLTEVENELLNLIPLATKYIVKSHALFIFTSNKKRITFKRED